MRALSVMVAWVLAGVTTTRAQTAPPGSDPCNLLPNPSFESVEPPPPTPQIAAAGGQAPPETWVPRTWDLGSTGAPAWRCLDDPGQAHNGRRCMALAAPGGSGWLRYGPVPAHRTGPWTLAVWARGTGTLTLGAYEVRPERWIRLAAGTAVALTAEWRQYRCELELPAGCRSWLPELSVQGPAEAWLDDVTLSCPGLQALPLPPPGPLGRDADTRLYLPFEEPFNEDAFYVGGSVGFTQPAAGGTASDQPAEGRFGRALALGREAYVAGSANENLDPATGTIELWFRLRSPGNDRVYRPLLSVPGPEGMALCKDQYAHLSFSFASGWQTLSRAWADGYAARWQPGVWRHLAVCWDREALQVFVDGKLIAWAAAPKLSRALGPELRIGSPDMDIDDLRISRVVRYRVPLPPAAP